MSQSKKTDYAGSTKPPRLEKVSPQSLPNTKNSRENKEPEEEATPLEKTEKESSTLKQNETGSASMSFEEAIRAGLVPPHILSREENHQEEEAD
jgi:hypothetical protein